LLKEWTINFWVNETGLSREKAVVGIPTFGVTYTLAEKGQHGIKAASVGPGQAGPYTKEPGVLAYYEVLVVLKSLFGLFKLYSSLFTRNGSKNSKINTQTDIGLQKRKSSFFVQTIMFELREL